MKASLIYVKYHIYKDLRRCTHSILVLVFLNYRQGKAFPGWPHS
jgi:hypothetical protein